MYQSVLVRCYLLRKVMPLLAVVAIALCVGMVLVVWSVMSGFLMMLLGSGRNLSGDVSLAYPGGIAHYEQLIERLEEDPAIAAATPTLESIGLIQVASGHTEPVQIVGIEPKGFARVTGYSQMLWWKSIEGDAASQDDPYADPRTQIGNEHEAHGALLTEPDPATGAPVPAVVPGIELGARTGMAVRTKEGWYQAPERRFGWFMPDTTVTLSVLPLTAQGSVIDVRARSFPVANEFKSDMYEADARQVFVRLDALQEMLGWHAAQRTAPVGTGNAFFGSVLSEDGTESFSTPRIVSVDPARVRAVISRGAEGFGLDEVKAVVERIYAEWAHGRTDVPLPVRVQAMTWEEQPGVARMAGAVQKEIALMLTLFGFISVTAAFMVLSLFWSMVSEKTKDIGVLRSLGASSWGVGGVFVRYGVALGVLGSAGGVAIACAVVLNINPIHRWIGEVFGIVVWDPSVYYFSEIPAVIDPVRAIQVFLAGVLMSVLGAILPAARAASLDPVEALRFE